MPNPFLLIPGRTSRQGTTLNEGKLTEGYLDEINSLWMCPDDMKQMGLKNGDRVRLKSETGASVDLPCLSAKDGELPSGLLFLAYGDSSSKLMSGDTQGTGMPSSKCFEVFLEKVDSALQDPLQFEGLKS